MEYVFGIDGGGTGCRVALANMSGHVLSRSSGGPANIETSFLEAKANIISVCKTALIRASLPESLLVDSGAVLGLAGSNMGDFDKELVKQLPFRRNLVLNDSEITLEGAIGSVDGCIAAIGTGSVYIGRLDGVVKQIGGWGFLLGDDGSGARLGRELLRTAIMCHEHLNNHSNLTKKIMADFDNKVVNIIKHTANFKPKDYAAYAPIIFDYYNKGDEAAQQILNKEVAIVEKSIITAGFNRTRPFCLLGGLGSSYKLLLKKELTDFIVTPIGDAVDGAISIALREFL
jgi:glucosamine kinase